MLLSTPAFRASLPRRASASSAVQPVAAFARGFCSDFAMEDESLGDDVTYDFGNVMLQDLESGGHHGDSGGDEAAGAHRRWL